MHVPTARKTAQVMKSAAVSAESVEVAVTAEAVDACASCSSQPHINDNARDSSTHLQFDNCVPALLHSTPLTNEHTAVNKSAALGDSRHGCWRYTAAVCARRHNDQDQESVSRVERWAVRPPIRQSCSKLLRTCVAVCLIAFAHSHACSCRLTTSSKSSSSTSPSRLSLSTHSCQSTPTRTHNDPTVVAHSLVSRQVSQASFSSSVRSSLPACIDTINLLALVPNTQL